MLDSPQHDFLTTELDPDLLSTPFRVQTNWHVITGAACSGKTTLIDLLADKGFQTDAVQMITDCMEHGYLHPNFCTIHN